MPDFRTEKMPALSYIYLERSAPGGPSEVALAMGEAFGVLMGFIGENAITPTGRPMCVYLDFENPLKTFRIGMPVRAEDAEKATGDVVAETVAAGPVLCGTHTGPYSGLHGTYKAMMNHAGEAGLKISTPVYETYLDDPGETPEAKLRTEIRMTLG